LEYLYILFLNSEQTILYLLNGSSSLSKLDVILDQHYKI
jgi:hypothetical protein